MVTTAAAIIDALRNNGSGDGKVMTKLDFISTLYNNRINVTIEVLDYVCMTLRLYEIN